ncbi:MAG: GntR family transcriptional regulator [Pseudomonadota bacterium]
MDGDFKPLLKEPTYLKVCRAIEEKITSGALRNGDPIPTEAELCAQFAVTRSTVREGIRLLEQTGLVARGPGKRLFVTRPEIGDIAAATSRSLSLGGATFQEVWESLAVAYPPAARMAAGRLNEAAVSRLREINAGLVNADDADSEVVVSGAVAFFHEIAAGLGNRVMLAMLDSLNFMIEASLRQIIEKAPRARARIVEAQARIIDAFAAKDGDTTEQWMRRHIDDIARGCEVAGVNLDAPVL